MVSSYDYDGLGNRTSQTVGGTTTEYVLDVAGGLPEVIVATMGGSSIYYVQVQRQVLAQYEASVWAHVLSEVSLPVAVEAHVTDYKLVPNSVVYYSGNQPGRENETHGRSD